MESARGMEVLTREAVVDVGCAVAGYEGCVVDRPEAIDDCCALICTMKAIEVYSGVRPIGSGVALEEV